MAIQRSYGTGEISQLYSDHHSWLKGWLSKKLGDTADAADIAQDTFVKIIRLRNSDLIREPRPYLTTIAKSVLIDFIRRKKIEQSYLDVLATLPETQLPSMEDQAIIIEALMELDEMLSGLGFKVKRAFLLSQFEDMRYSDIAQELDVSLRTVKNYIAKALEHICLFRLRNGI